MTAREKLSKTENKLSGIIYERGVDEKGFVIIRSEGDKALFGGRSTQDMKCKLTVPKHRPPKTLKKWNAASKLRKRKPCKNPIK